MIGFSRATHLLNMAIPVGSWRVGGYGGPCAESAGSEVEVAMTSERLTRADLVLGTDPAEGLLAR
jgi:hypothetical protein